MDVNRSTYYKHLRRQPSPRQQENVEIRKQILELYTKSDKRLGVRKMRFCLVREYCVSISECQVYRLMKEMKLPKISTIKSAKAASADKKNDSSCENLLAQKFNQTAPNLVWVSDFTFVKAASKFYHVA